MNYRAPNRHSLLSHVPNLMRISRWPCCDFHSVDPMTPNKALPTCAPAQPHTTIPLLASSERSLSRQHHLLPSSLEIQLSSVISRSLQFQKIHGLKYPSLQAQNFYFSVSQGGNDIKRRKRKVPPRIEMCLLHNQRACLKTSTNSLFQALHTLYPLSKSSIPAMMQTKPLFPQKAFCAFVIMDLYLTAIFTSIKKHNGYYWI